VQAQDLRKPDVFVLNDDNQALSVLCTGNKLQSISPTIDILGYQQLRSLSRRDAVIIHRLRIGHTR